MSHKSELPPGPLDSADPKSVERRGFHRHAFRPIQIVAPYRDGRPLDLAAFHPIRCLDLSRGGISFCTEKPPLDEFLIIALGQPPDANFIKARMTNCIRMGESRDASYRVGCEFLMRMGAPRRRHAGQGTSPDWGKAPVYFSAESNEFQAASAAAMQLDRLLEPFAACLSPDVAGKAAGLQADEAMQDRIDYLARRCDEELLTAEEYEEYADYLHAIDVLAALQAKARSLAGKP